MNRLPFNEVATCQTHGLLDGHDYAFTSDGQTAYCLIDIGDERYCNMEVRMVKVIAADDLFERIANFGGFKRTEQGGFWINRDDVYALIDELTATPQWSPPG